MERESCSSSTKYMENVGWDSFIKNLYWREGEEGRKVGSPSLLSPANYLDNFQIILKIYKFGLRFKQRTAGMPH